MMHRNKYIFLIVFIVLIALVVGYFRQIVVWLLIASVVFILARPLRDFLRKRKIGRYALPLTLCAALTLFAIVLLVFSFFALFIPLIIDEARIISSISIQDVLVSFNQPIEYIDKVLNKYQLGGGKEFHIKEYLKPRVASFIDFARLSTFANAFVGTIGDILIAVFSVSFITFFFLKDENKLYGIFLSVVPSAYKTRVQNIVTHSRKMLTKYFLGLLLESAVVTLLIFIGLSILGVDNALIIAFLSGILNIIPYVGPLIAASIGIVIGVSANLQLDFYTAMLPFIAKVVVVYMLVQFIDNMFLQPWIFSNTVNAHPLEIFIVIIMAGSLTGIGGMIIAIPAYTVIRIIAKEFFSNFEVIKRITGKLDKDHGVTKNDD